MDEQPLELKHYHLLSRVEGAGVGAVYRARDGRVGRTVLLHVLEPGPDLEADEIRRMADAARAASALGHPGLATLYDVDTEGETTFIASELVRGATLRELLAEGPLPAARLIECARHVAEGLAAVHRGGLVHGELGPESVVASEAGYCKITGLGLPRRSPAEAPDPGDAERSLEPTRLAHAAGVMPCMSPEQARGESADPRSDVFSLGALIHELATGRHPFARETEVGTYHALVHEEPGLLAAGRSDLPPGLSDIVARCLAREPDARYPSAVELAEELRSLSMPEISTPRGRPSGLQALRRSVSPLGALAVVLALVALAVVVAWSLRAPTGPRSSPAALARPPGLAPSATPAASSAGLGPVAVTFFAVNSSDPTVRGLGRGLPEMLTTDLARARGLEVVSTQHLYDLLELAGKDDTAELDRSAAAELARWAGAGTVVTGAVFGTAEHLRIDAQAYDIATGQVLVARKVEGSDLLGMVDELSRGLLEGLEVALPAGEDLGTVMTASTEAFRRYTDGMAAYRELRFGEATALFGEALDADPGFDLARLRLGMSLYLGGDREGGAESVLAVGAATGRLPARERLLLGALHAFLGDGDAAAVARRLDELEANHPGDPESPFWRARSQASLDGDLRGAIRILRRELVRDPRNALAAAALAGHFEDLGLAEEARLILDGFRARSGGVGVALRPLRSTS